MSKCRMCSSRESKTIYSSLIRIGGGVEEVDGVFDRIFDKHYKAEIERLGISSHLFITAERPL